MTTLLAIAIDVAVVSLAALLGVAAMRRQSAALRHAVLALAVVAAALMPLFELALPTGSSCVTYTILSVMASSIRQNARAVTGRSPRCGYSSAAAGLPLNDSW